MNQPRIRALMAPASPARSVALRRLRCQSLICLPIACFALGLMACEKPVGRLWVPETLSWLVRPLFGIR